MTSVYASQATLVVGSFSYWIGVSQPSALWRRCRLWKISRYAKPALASSTRVVHRLRSSSSVCIPVPECFDEALSLASPMVSIEAAARSPVGTRQQIERSAERSIDLEPHDGGMGDTTRRRPPTSGRLPSGLHAPGLY